MQTKRVIPKTKLITLALENTKPLLNMSSSSLIISCNIPPQSIEIWNKDSSYTTVCRFVTDYYNKPLKSWTKMWANQFQLRKQHFQPTTLQRILWGKKHEDHLRVGRGTLGLVDIVINKMIMGHGKWSFLCMNGKHLEPDA
jgi:hypothetical protein